MNRRRVVFPDYPYLSAAESSEHLPPASSTSSNGEVYQCTSARRGSPPIKIIYKKVKANLSQPRILNRCGFRMHADDGGHITNRKQCGKLVIYRLSFVGFSFHRPHSGNKSVSTFKVENVNYIIMICVICQIGMILFIYLYIYIQRESVIVFAINL